MSKESENKRAEIFELGLGKVCQSFGYETVNTRKEGKVLFKLRHNTMSLHWAYYRDVLEQVTRWGKPSRVYRLPSSPEA